jgi:hypothetical protein
MVLFGYSGAQGTLIYEKNLKPKISCQTPFNVNFLGKKFYNSLKIGPTFFLRQFKTKIIFNFVIFLAKKKDRTTIFFILPSLLHKSSFNDFFRSGTLFFEIYFLLANDQNSTFPLLKENQMLIFFKFITL